MIEIFENVIADPVVATPEAPNIPTFRVSGSAVKVVVLAVKLLPPSVEYESVTVSPFRASTKMSVLAGWVSVVEKVLFAIDAPAVTLEA